MSDREPSPARSSWPPPTLRAGDGPRSGGGAKMRPSLEPEFILFFSAVFACLAVACLAKVQSLKVSVSLDALLCRRPGDHNVRVCSQTHSSQSSPLGLI